MESTYVILPGKIVPYLKFLNVTSLLSCVIIFKKFDEHYEGWIQNVGRWIVANPAGKTMISILLLIIGILLYQLREKRRMVYSTLEMFVGIMTIYYSLPKLATDSFSGILAILGGLYIIVRSCDNLKKASDEKRKALVKERVNRINEKRGKAL